MRHSQIGIRSWAVNSLVNEKLPDNKNLKTGFEPSDQQNSVFVDDLGVADGEGRVGLAEVHHLQVSNIFSKKDSRNI